MENFWDYNVWGSLNLIACLLLSLLAANTIYPCITDTYFRTWRCNSADYKRFL